MNLRKALISFVFPLTLILSGLAGCADWSAADFANRISSMSEAELKDWLEKASSQSTSADKPEAETTKAKEEFKRNTVRTDVLGITVEDASLASAFEKKGITFKLRMTSSEQSQLIAAFKGKNYIFQLNANDSLEVDQNKLSNRMKLDDPMTNDFAYRSNIFGKVYQVSSIPELYFFFTRAQLVGGCSSYTCKDDRRMSIMTSKDVYRSEFIRAPVSPTYERKVREN